MTPRGGKVVIRYAVGPVVVAAGDATLLAPSPRGDFQFPQCPD